jgi:hypothetical protein
LALACGGTAFSSSDAGSNGGTNAEGATAGVFNRGGHHSGGSSNKAGQNNGGTDIGGTDIGGTDVGGTDVGGTTSGGTDVGGTSSGGTSNGGTNAGGTNAGGTNSGGVSSGGTGVAGGATGGTVAMGGMGGGTSIDIVCPKNQPSDGHACKDGLVCSYGQDIRSSCRNIATCANGVWGVDKPNCSGLGSCSNTLMAGSACVPAMDMPCQLNKQYCMCNSCPGPVCMVDSGTWECAGASGANCPEMAPNEGQACTGARDCVYGSCAVAEGVTASCGADSVWSWKAQNCPLRAAAP